MSVFEVVTFVAFDQAASGFDDLISTPAQRIKQIARHRAFDKGKAVFLVLFDLVGRKHHGDVKHMELAIQSHIDPSRLILNVRY